MGAVTTKVRCATHDLIAPKTDSFDFDDVRCAKCGATATTDEVQTLPIRFVDPAEWFDNGPIRMKKQIKDVHTVQVIARCDAQTIVRDGARQLTGPCGGELIFTNVTLTMNPPVYPHKCNRCGRTETLDQIYPCIEYR